MPQWGAKYAADAGADAATILSTFYPGTQPAQAAAPCASRVLDAPDGALVVFPAGGEVRSPRDGAAGGRLPRRGPARRLGRPPPRRRRLPRRAAGRRPPGLRRAVHPAPRAVPAARTAEAAEAAAAVGAVSSAAPPRRHAPPPPPTTDTTAAPAVGAAAGHRPASGRRSGPAAASGGWRDRVRNRCGPSRREAGPSTCRPAGAPIAASCRRSGRAFGS